MTQTETSSRLLTAPPELLLRLFSFLDIPDLSALASTSRYLASLVADPLLNRTRILVISPSRIAHSLFAVGAHGVPLRPSVPDLVHRGVFQGIAIERRWRLGLYLYSPLSVVNYESALRLQRGQASNAVSSNLRRRSRSPNLLHTLHTTRVLPDVESSSLSVARSLLPVMRKLKWSLRKDSLAKKVRDRDDNTNDSHDHSTPRLLVARWIENRGTLLTGESERVRLALCPGVRKIVHFYEHIATAT
ncbi:hypothetical protein OF83DRAFT_1099962 [Amylostereum chailletii]|nr:hypothetical protein OF83DRAFT_1099962 [Amylostereum chailletii]